MKRIAVIFTGGTISMKVDDRLKAAIPGLSNQEILSMVTNIDKVAEIVPINFGNYPSTHMNLNLLSDLSRLVRENLEKDNIDGVVITHGTDSLEETAYFLDLNIDSIKPIIIVAAMRNSSELGHDGPSNLSAAISTAASDKACNKGVLVVMNNEINTASEVTKSHTLSLDTFKSLEFGPLGVFDNNEVIFYRESKKESKIITTNVCKDIPLFKTYLGMEGRYLRYAINDGVKGIVIEGMGRGNVPPALVPIITDAINQGIVVVLTSRCPIGRVRDSYGYYGGGKNLRDVGVIFAGNLNGQKARIKLALALGSTNDVIEIKRLFESDYFGV